MNESDEVRFEQDGGVATITLDAPERMNAFSAAMGRGLSQAFIRCDGDDAIRAVVVTGSGRAFCAGADMSAGEGTFASPADQAGADDAPGFSATPFDPPAWAVRKPVIAAMNGHAVGLGLTLALQCDLRIAALEGRYGILQVRRGVMPDACSHWTLPRIVGQQQAAYLMLSGRKIDGAEAERIGLVLRALPADEVLPFAQALAAEIAIETAPLSVAVTKRLLWESPGLDIDQVEQIETDLHHVLMGAPDALEGGLAYLERRKPRFTSAVSRDWPEWPRPPKRGE